MFSSVGCLVGWLVGLSLRLPVSPSVGLPACLPVCLSFCASDRFRIYKYEEKDTSGSTWVEVKSLLPPTPLSMIKVSK